MEPRGAKLAPTASHRREAASPESSYHVTLVPGTRDLRWEAVVDGREANWSHEPEAPAERRAADAFLRLVPLDSQL